MIQSQEFFKEAKKGMHNFGENISTMVNSILLAVVYIVGIGITAILAKIFKKHFLDMKISKKRKTYWSNLNLRRKPIEEYYKQF